jgi:DNA/RNA endonuclease YhcR with UshA esterase domain
LNLRKDLYNDYKMEPTVYKRPSALKLSIKDILNGTFIQGENQQASYLLLGEHKAYYIDVAASVVSMEKIGTITNIILDDGTGKIIARSFEENKSVFQTKVGDIVRIIGKLRVYNQERYLSPELIKAIDPLWLKVRSLRLGLEQFPDVSVEAGKDIIFSGAGKNDKNNASSQGEVNSKNIKNVLLDDDLDNTLLPVQKLAALIKELDNGDGVLIEEIIEKSQLENSESILKKMIENGEIFQNSPGKVKVL